MFEYIVSIVCILLLSTFGIGQKNGPVWEIAKSNGIHQVRIVIRTRSFRATQHRIKMVSNQEVLQTWIDGKLALGTDATLPRKEISSFRLIYDGKNVPVPTALFVDCFDPNLDKDYFWVKFADDGQSVMAFMAGSDGAGGYQVFWILRSDGRHSRFSNAVSDADYVDFTRWFF